MEKINIAELLKDCPKGMKLDCTIYDECTLRSILEGEQYPIKLQTPEGSLLLTKYGSLSLCTHSKCVIFPKGKTTWEGFVPPCEFEDGDIVSTMNGIWIGIVKKTVNSAYETYVTINGESLMYNNSIFCFERFATEEEREKLSQAIKDNGYEWDPDTKTLNEFKIKKGKWYVCIKKGYDEYDNVIFHKGDTYYSPENGKLMPGNSNIPREILCGDEYFREWTISDAKDGDVLYSDNEDDDDRYKSVFILKEIIGYRVIAHCFINVDGFTPTETFLVENTYPIRLATEEEEARLFQAIKDYGYKWNPKTKTLEMLIEPKFKEGNIIRLKDDNEKPFYKIINIKNDCYITDHGELHFRYEYLWELVPNKFDITTLVPFESKVLVRAVDNQFWRPAIWGVKHWDWDFCCVLGGEMWEQCIPYEGNEHLLGTSNNCDEFYKTWE